MQRRSSIVCGIAASLCVAAGASAQTLGPEFAGIYTLQDLGGINDVPVNYGGITFLRGDPNSLLIGGAANGGFGRIYVVPVVRDTNGHITGFGQAADFCDGANNDGGLDYAPNGTLFVAQYPNTTIGQVLPGQTTFASNLGMPGVAGTLGGVTWVPPQQPGAGRLKVATYSGSIWHNLHFTVNPNGTYTFTGADPGIQLQGGSEGFVYVPGCSTAFIQASILTCEYGFGIVSTYFVDDNGDPLLGSRRVFVSGLSGAEGAVIDPVSGDFLFGTYGSGNRIIRVSGFPPPANCPCDWNHAACVNSQDFFDFIGDFFANRADFNEDGMTNSQDFFDFLACFFGGCN